MKTKYQKAFQAVTSIKSSKYNLSKSEGFAAMHRDMWNAICAAGLKITPRQALRAFVGPKNGHWTAMDMAQYIAERSK